MKTIKAYKVFNEDWSCRNFKYEIGKTYTHKGNIGLCEAGFHACLKLIDCFNYYNFDPKNKVAEVELIGEFIHGEDKSVANKIKIIKELSWSEVLNMVNVGSGNTGKGNSGYLNSGDRNSGDRNSGDRNSGDLNSVYLNSGDRNSGDLNSVYLNSGDRNSGDRNSGDRNSGDLNSGDLNSGDRNSGDRNSGDRNSGDRNSGDRNSGDRNSGYLNSGDRNSGYLNSGYLNSGLFCTKTRQDKIEMFNKESNWTWSDWENSRAWGVFRNLNLTEWVWWSDMTDDEKKEHPKAFVCDGYLKVYKYKDAFKTLSAEWSKEDIKTIKALPNFDSKIFEEITGLKV